MQVELQLSATGFIVQATVPTFNIVVCAHRRPVDTPCLGGHCSFCRCSRTAVPTRMRDSASGRHGTRARRDWLAQFSCSNTLPNSIVISPHTQQYLAALTPAAYKQHYYDNVQTSKKFERLKSDKNTFIH